MIYEYKGHPYKKIGECLSKNPDTRNWYNAVIYTRQDVASDTYVREKEDFYNKFKPLEP